MALPARLGAEVEHALSVLIAFALFGPGEAAFVLVLTNLRRAEAA